MEKKATIRDVAREAGVSTATVSYVMNNRTDQTISEEVRCKVLQIANLLNYKPNALAKNLRTSPDSKLISVCSADFGSSLYRAEYMHFLKTLGSVFPSEKYNLVLTELPYRHFDNADAIIAVNLSKQAFCEIAQLNYVPLIAVDCIINDEIFFQVTTDYTKLKSHADERFDGDYVFCCLTPADDGVKEEILSTFNSVVFAEKFSDVDAIINKNILTDSKAICEFLYDKGLTPLFVEDLSQKKCEKVAVCLEKVLRRESFDVHFYKI